MEDNRRWCLFRVIKEGGFFWGSDIYVEILRIRGVSYVNGYGWGGGEYEKEECVCVCVWV